MVNTHEGKYICGYCKKETPLPDDVLITIIDSDKGIEVSKTICSCGHHSYASSIRFKANYYHKDWRGAQRIGIIEK